MSRRAERSRIKMCLVPCAMIAAVLAGSTVAGAAAVRPARAITLKSTDAAAIYPWGVFTDAGAAQVALAKVVPKSGVRPESFWIVEKPPSFWIAERRVKTNAQVATLQWADSRSCNGLATALAMLSDLKAAPSSGAAGALYLIDLKGAPGGDLPEIHLGGGQGGAAARWVDAAAAALRPCWSEAPPSLDP